MKKTLLTTLLASLVALSVRADLVWYEPFDYVDGPTIAVSTNLDGTTNWFRHSGTTSPSDSLIHNHRLEVSTTGSGYAAPARSDDVHRNLATVADSPYTNTPIVLYASFTMNCTNLPTAAGAYFAHFMVTSSVFNCRVWALTGGAALPGTYRLGISGGGLSTPSRVFPVDLATNTDYQVVIGWDPVTLYAATIWINPISSTDFSLTSNDPVTAPAPQTAFAFRQASGFGGFVTISNLAVATTFDEAATNVWATNAVAPVIAYPPTSQTNFVGDTVNLSVVAAGQGLAGLTYEWRKNGVDVANPYGNTNVLTLNGAAVSDTGNYDVVVTTPYGDSVTSASAFLWITNPPVPPTLTVEPTNTTVYFGQTATLAVEATGPGTLAYLWYYNGSPAVGPNFSGYDTPVLTVSNVQTNNDTTGSFRCDVSNVYGTTPSDTITLAAAPVPLVSIGYLRTLVDPVYFLPTNTTALYSARGIVTTWADMTGGANLQFYMQDDTGGITVFLPGGAAMRPEAGDSVTVTGPLGAFNGLLELNLSATDPSNGVTVNSTNNLLPPGIVLPFNFTNGVAVGGVGNAIRLYQSSVVTFTNVWFPAGYTNGTFSAGSTYLMTNSAGEEFKLFLNAALTNWNGVPIPQFAWTISGPLGYFLNNTATDRSSGFEFDPSRPEDIVTNTPAAVTSTLGLAAGQPVLTWTAQPYMSYSIYRAAGVTGPYVPLATGLTFNTTAGHYTDASPVTGTRFYKITSP
jgi:Immunoglobulin domain